MFGIAKETNAIAARAPLLLLVPFLLTPPHAAAQQAIGSVATGDATVDGSIEITGTRARLIGSSSVTARDHATEIALERGGIVRVCQTSVVHLSCGVATPSGSYGAASRARPLMLALDRGAIELLLPATLADMILTPDLRFSLSGAPALLDLRLRVTPNGDTCVENSGLNAPTLHITDSFGEATYELHANQHVLFEHGSLREVVDHESSPCGCPPATRTMSLAEAALAPNTPAAKAASEHPFPSAESTGLAPTPAIPQSAPGDLHTQVATTLTFDSADPAPAPPTAPPAPPTPPPPPAKPHGFAHALDRFFHRLFGGS